MFDVSRQRVIIETSKCIAIILKVYTGTNYHSKKCMNVCIELNRFWDRSEICIWVHFAWFRGPTV